MGNCPTPLRRATRFNEIDRARKILDDAGAKAADIINLDHAPDCILGSCSREHGNCFYYAVQRGRTEIVAMMLEHGADIHTTGIWDETCLQRAVRHNYVEIAHMLVKAGCDAHTTDDMGNLPIHSTGTSHYNTSDLIKFLLEEVGSREDVNAKNYIGRTPLHGAAAWGNSEPCNTLLSYGADINAKSNNGLTPLHVTRKAYMFDLLLGKGADPKALDNKGFKPVRPAEKAMY